MDLFLQGGDDHHGQPAKGPARQHVRGIMSAHDHAGEAHQQREQDAQPGGPLRFYFGRQRAVSGDGVGGMAAGEGIALGGNIVNIRRIVHRTVQLDFRVVKVGPPPEDDVFDHQAPAGPHQHGQTDFFGHALVQAPIEEAEQQEQKDRFPERREKGNDGNGALREDGLQPFHQAYFPGKSKGVAGQGQWMSRSLRWI